MNIMDAWTKCFMLCACAAALGCIGCAPRWSEDPRLNDRVWGYDIPHCGTAMVQDQRGGIIVIGIAEGDAAQADRPGSIFWRMYDSGYGVRSYIENPSEEGIAEAYGICVDHEGYIYMAGTKADQTIRQMGEGSEMRNDQIMSHIFVTKRSIVWDEYPIYHEEWTRTWGGSGAFAANNIAIDSQGNICIAGIFSGSLDWTVGAVSFQKHAVGMADACVFILDRDGRIQNVLNWGGPGNDRANGVAIDADGRIHVVGCFKDTMTLNTVNGLIELSSNGKDDCFYIVLDSGGHILFAASWGGASEDLCSRVAICGNQVFVAGYFSDSIHPFPEHFDDLYASNGETDAFAMSFDNSNNPLWIRTWGGTKKDWGVGLCVDSVGSAYITGTFAGTVDFDPSQEIAEESTASIQDVYLLKLNRAGEFEWVRVWGYDYSEDYGIAAIIDDRGNVDVTGRLGGRGFLKTFTASGREVF